jgi:hypothetical protein
MKSLELTKISTPSVAELRGSFDRLPETEHKDGKFRLRRYSVIELRTSFWNAKEEAEIRHLPVKDFTQSEDYNKHQGGMKRTFENIEEEVLQSDGFKEICLIFKNANNMIDGQEIDVHQMRCVTLNGESELAPEGVHQDGFDRIGMVSIDRHNISGGEVHLYQNRYEVDQGGPLNTHESEPFLRYVLDDGEMVMIDDKKLWHWGSPVVANTAEQGYMDMFILCAHLRG